MGAVRIEARSAAAMVALMASASSVSPSWVQLPRVEAARIMSTSVAADKVFPATTLSVAHWFLPTGISPSTLSCTLSSLA